MKYLALKFVISDKGGIQNSYTLVCPPVQEIIHSLKLMDYLLVQADKPLYNYNLSMVITRTQLHWQWDSIFDHLLVNVAMRLLTSVHLLLGRTLGCHLAVTSEIYCMQSETKRQIMYYFFIKSELSFERCPGRVPY